jgi:hypothetical protein
MEVISIKQVDENAFEFTEEWGKEDGVINIKLPKNESGPIYSITEDGNRLEIEYLGSNVHIVGRRWLIALYRALGEYVPGCKEA